MIVYIESSAAAKLILDEAESPALAAWLDEFRDDGMTVFSTTLLETELRRAAAREGASQQAVTSALDRFGILDLERSDYRTAGLLPGNVRSLDALHVAAALRINADVMVSYDERQLEAARNAGIHTVSPT